MVQAANLRWWGPCTPGVRSFRSWCFQLRQREKFCFGPIVDGAAKLCSNMIASESADDTTTDPADRHSDRRRHASDGGSSCADALAAGPSQGPGANDFGSAPYGCVRLDYGYDVYRSTKDDQCPSRVPEELGRLVQFRFCSGGRGMVVDTERIMRTGLISVEVDRLRLDVVSIVESKVPFSACVLKKQGGS